ncbi:hypothetical protein [Staphylococcus aureus]
MTQKIFFCGWKKEIFFLKGKNINFFFLPQIFYKLKKFYEGYKIVVIPIKLILNQINRSDEK